MVLGGCSPVTSGAILSRVKIKSQRISVGWRSANSPLRGGSNGAGTGFLALRRTVVTGSLRASAGLGGVNY